MSSQKLQNLTTGNRLCYILSNSLPYTSNGYATRAHGLALALKGNGVDILCLTRPGFPIDVLSHSHEEIGDTDEIECLTYKRILEPSKRQNSESDYIIKAAEKIRLELMEQNIGLVIAASNYLNALPALMAAKSLGLAFIYEVRGLWEITRMSGEPKFKNTSSFKYQFEMESFVAKRADHVLTLTQEVKEELIHRGVRGENVSIAPNACDINRFTPIPRNLHLHKDIGIPDAVPVIGYVGSFVQYEGLDDLAKACTILHQNGTNFFLLLVGDEPVKRDGRTPLKEEIIEISLNGGWRHKLFLTGRVQHDEVEQYYSLIDIAPFPRKSQQVTELVAPIKPLEALAMGKAVVVSAVAPLTEIVRNGKNGLVFDRGNVEEFAGILDKLINNRDLRAQLGEAGRQWVKSERTWDKVSKLILERISEVNPRISN